MDSFTSAPSRSSILEEAAAHLTLTIDAPAAALRLAYGEMTAQEIRTVRAVLTQQAAAIRSLATKEKGDPLPLDNPNPYRGW